MLNSIENMKNLIEDRRKFELQAKVELNKYVNDPSNLNEMMKDLRRVEIPEFKSNVLYELKYLREQLFNIECEKEFHLSILKRAENYIEEGVERISKATLEGDIDSIYYDCELLEYLNDYEEHEIDEGIYFYFRDIKDKHIRTANIFSKIIDKCFEDGDWRKVVL